MSERMTFTTTYEGRIEEVSGRQFRIERENKWLTMPEGRKPPSIGRYVLATVDPHCAVVGLHVRGPLTERIIRKHQESSVGV